MKQLQLIKTVCLYWHKETKSITLQVTVSESRVRAALNRATTFQRVPKLKSYDSGEAFRTLGWIKQH